MMFMQYIRTAISEEEKISFTSQFSDHLIQVQADQSQYQILLTTPVILPNSIICHTIPIK